MPASGIKAGCSRSSYAWPSRASRCFVTTPLWGRGSCIPRPRFLPELRHSFKSSERPEVMGITPPFPRHCDCDQRNKSQITMQAKPATDKMKPPKQCSQSIRSAEVGKNRKTPVTHIAAPDNPITSIHRMVAFSRRIQWPGRASARWDHWIIDLEIANL
jgi:hypothetical protein